MTKHLVYTICAITSIVSINAQKFNPVSVTGFNIDCIYDVGESLDTQVPIDVKEWVFYTKAVKSDGGINSKQIVSPFMNTTYTLADYKSKNALRLTTHSNGDNSGELILTSGVQTSLISILGMSANGKKDIKVRVNYTDGTSSEVKTISFDDWYGRKDEAVITNLGRLNVSNASYDGRNDFSLFEKMISTDSNKTIKSLKTEVSNSDGSFTCIFAISALDKDETLVSNGNTVYFINNSHLDTQWNWDVTTTIDDYIYRTMVDNFKLFEEYPDFKFNFEGAVKYKWMKEYYPAEYEKLKNYVELGKWNISGAAWDANDVMVPSAESLIRNFLYGQEFYKKEFGHKGGSDIMLPDCFGFTHALPTIGKHCGITGFHTQKLSWGSAYDTNNLPDFGIWEGVDGSQIYAIFKPGAYDAAFRHNTAFDFDLLKSAQKNKDSNGLGATFRYTGKMGDRGGAIDNECADYLQQSMNSTGVIDVKMISPTEAFDIIKDNDCGKYQVVNHELPMKTHGVGCYSSQTILKYWNRKNELLGEETEKASVVADWMGSLSYQSETIRESWKRFLWHQFHDDLPGTSIPKAYVYSYNDQVLSQLEFSKTLLNASGAISRRLATNVANTPIVVYNPLSIERNDIIEGSIISSSPLSAIRIKDREGKEVLSQLTKYKDGKQNFIFVGTVPSLGYAVFDLEQNVESNNTNSQLSIKDNTLENSNYIVTVNTDGDVSSIYSKTLDKELLKSPIKFNLIFCESLTWPAWELHNDQLKGDKGFEYVKDNVKISVAEDGPVRKSLKIEKSQAGSTFVQYVILSSGANDERVDFVNEIDWQSREKLLKTEFDLTASNNKATYDISIGTVERGNSTDAYYEYAAHQWTDLTDKSGDFGVSILNDCKYGWDKPDDNKMRMSVVYTPKVKDNYTHHGNQDLGLNKFKFSVYAHKGKWNEKTQWEAAKLNQPMYAFESKKYNGDFGSSISFANVNSEKIAIKTIKKSESGDNIIVRVFELTGESQENLKITFPENIISATEVNGIEEYINDVNFDNKTISFNMTKYQPRTFAIKLASPGNSVVDNPASINISIPYNVDVISDDKNMNDGEFCNSGFAYPAELLNNNIIADGINFEIGPTVDNVNNATSCQGQVIPLPVNHGKNKLYILAASGKNGGSYLNLKIDNRSKNIKVDYFAGMVGQFGTVFNNTLYRNDNCAFTATHKHDINAQRNISYQYMHIYKYAIEIDKNTKEITLPSDDDIVIFAMTLSDNENDDIRPMNDIEQLPSAEYIVNDNTLVPEEDFLMPKSIYASNYVSDSENPDKACDSNPFSKWCDNKGDTQDKKWIEYDFERDVEIHQWSVLHAGIEKDYHITSDFRLQYYNQNGDVIDADKVVNNTNNKTNRIVNPFTTRKVRLMLDKEEQTRGNARIYEFNLYGREINITGITEHKSAANFNLIGHYPGYVKNIVTIRCEIMDKADLIDFSIYNTTGVKVDSWSCEAENNGIFTTTHNLNIEPGIYFYNMSVINNKNIVYSSSRKMIVTN